MQSKKPNIETLEEVKNKRITKQRFAKKKKIVGIAQILGLSIPLDKQIKIENPNKRSVTNQKQDNQTTTTLFVPSFEERFFSPHKD